MILKIQTRLSPEGRRRLLETARAKVPGARLAAGPGGFRVLGLTPAAAADAAPLLENLEGAAGVAFNDVELCPLACAGGRRPFSRPLDFTRGPVFIAGPCAVEDEASYLSSARALKAAGAHALRAALFKPRSSPYAFQGLGWEGLKIISRAKKETGLPLVTEATDTRQVARLAAVCDVLQVGARNMRNYELLKEIGRSRRAALLKRAAGATLREWLLSAEYLLKYGARTLLLCERGRGAGALDLRLLREAKKLTGLPVLADPSHAAGTRERALALALKALRGGADGLLIEAAANPYSARVDGRQTVTLETFGRIAGRRK
ncbi:MAG: 3-deoxy-7-phosphoheptulonate synthase [Elusimicrobiales bacterium]